MKMKTPFRNKRALTALLTVVLLMGTFGTFNVSAQRRYYRGPHHSRAKGALIGAGIGLIGGALVGGRGGALMGPGAGEGTGICSRRHWNTRRFLRSLYADH